MLKKWLFICLLVLLAIPGIANAAGSYTVTPTLIDCADRGGACKRFQLVIVLTADASTGAMPDVVISPNAYGINGYYLYTAKTKPGSPAPTNNYSIALNDADGLDMSGGSLGSRSSSSMQQVYMSSFPMINGNWTVHTTSTSVNSAVIAITLTFTQN